MYGAKIGGIIVVMATGFTFNFLYFSISLLDEEDRRAQKTGTILSRMEKKIKVQSKRTEYFD